jgi:hypothetical protein
MYGFDLGQKKNPNYFMHVYLILSLFLSAKERKRTKTFNKSFLVWHYPASKRNPPKTKRHKARILDKIDIEFLLTFKIG